MTADRIGSYGFGAGVGGLLLALLPFGAVPAAVLLVVGVLLGLLGWVGHARGDSLVGLLAGATGLVVLFVEAATALTIPTSPYYWMP